MYASVLINLFLFPSFNRYVRLQHVVNRHYWDAPFAYNDGSSKEQRRADVAAALVPEVYVVPQARLLSLLQQSLKWQRYVGK
jgi:hypothetical protein